MGKKSRLAEAGRFCQLRIGVARLVGRQAPALLALVAFPIVPKTL